MSSVGVLMYRRWKSSDPKTPIHGMTVRRCQNMRRVWRIMELLVEEGNVYPSIREIAAKLAQFDPERRVPSTSVVRSALLALAESGIVTYEKVRSRTTRLLQPFTLQPDPYEESDGALHDRSLERQRPEPGGPVVMPIRHKGRRG